MKKGKLYAGGGVIVLCTGAGKAKYPSFSGTVVESSDPLNSIKQGEHSTTWGEGSFKDYDKAVNLRSKNTETFETC